MRVSTSARDTLKRIQPNAQRVAMTAHFHIRKIRYELFFEVVHGQHTALKNARNTKSVSKAKLSYFKRIFRVLIAQQEKSSVKITETLKLLDASGIDDATEDGDLAFLCVKRISFFLYFYANR